MKILTLLLISLHLYPQEPTFKDGCTTYYINRCYSHGGNMVKRSETNKKLFLKSKSLKTIPKGYQIDHIKPLSQGGTDCPENMQLLSIAEHRRKTASEAKKRNN